MLVQQSHKHHYIPQWYQKRFLAGGQTAFKVLDLHPPIFKDKSGAVRGFGRSILDKGPEAHFWESDLYTVRFFGRPDDIIERMLFGPIDKLGQTAIDAWVAADYNVVHHTYWQLYEFMDALRLRTPKGLRFVSAMAQRRDQQALMAVMQQLRRMHCVMWAEGVLEIAQAPAGGPQFIFSDHPVTLFNSYCFPGDASIPAGSDPHLHWIGTQTLFPFDKNNVYILTHVEWARQPGRHKSRKPRTNARYFDQDNPMVRYDECIRGRVLTPQQVLEVNYIIKKRADRYIAGRTVDDLYPEKHLKTIQWNKLGQFLVPSEHKVTRQSGYTVMKFKNGGYHFQDQFGRQPKSKAEFELEVQRAREMEATVKHLLAKDRTEKS